MTTLITAAKETNFYTDTVRYFFVFKLNVRTFDVRKNKVHHFHNVQSEKKRKKDGLERDSKSRLLITISCTTPLNHENIW